MSTLREKMIDVMEMCGLSRGTQGEYLRSVSNLADFHQCSPELDRAEVQEYLLYLIRDRKLSHSTINCQVAAFRFLYERVLGRSDVDLWIPRRREPQRLPEVLSYEELDALFASCRTVRNRALLKTTYAAGLRVSEVTRLELSDIDSQRMQIHIRGGKGQKDRYTILTQGLLLELRAYWRAERPQGYLFPGEPSDTPLTTGAAYRAFVAAKKRAGIVKKGGIHMHLHCLVPGGMLALDGNRWIETRPGFLFPVRPLSLVFREKFLDARSDAAAKGKLDWPQPRPEQPVPASDLAALIPRLRRRRWVVYCKPPVAGPDQVLQYLSRYVYRVAIANSRIVSYDYGNVTFSYKDRKHQSRTADLTLPADEFLRRFLLHVLPSGTRRIRHYGLLANRTKKKHLARCRELLGVPSPPPAADNTARELMLRLTGTDISRCPCCRQGHLRTVRRFDPLYFLTATSPEAIDTS
jgi:site-specific recombinase XerD